MTRVDLSTILIGEAKRLGDYSRDEARDMAKICLGVSSELYDNIWNLYYKVHFYDMGTTINNRMNTMEGAVKFAEHYLDRIHFCNESTYYYLDRKRREQELIDLEIDRR